MSSVCVAVLGAMLVFCPSAVKTREMPSVWRHCSLPTNYSASVPILDLLVEHPASQGPCAVRRFCASCLIGPTFCAAYVLWGSGWVLRFCLRHLGIVLAASFS